MYGLATIVKMNEKTYTGGVKPKIIRTVEDGFKVRNSAGKKLNEYGFKLIERLFVDSSGFGADYEPALSVRQFQEKIQELLNEHGKIYGVITDEGQFQVYINIYKKA